MGRLGTSAPLGMIEQAPSKAALPAAMANRRVIANVFMLARSPVPGSWLST